MFVLFGYPGIKGWGRWFWWYFHLKQHLGIEVIKRSIEEYTVMLLVLNCAKRVETWLHHLVNLIWSRLNIMIMIHKGKDRKTAAVIFQTMRLLLFKTPVRNVRGCLPAVKDWYVSALYGTWLSNEQVAGSKLLQYLLMTHSLRLADVDEAQTWLMFVKPGPSLVYLGYGVQVDLGIKG
ncbi:hypothetical protein HanLR1_Chr05g0167951 [Helianthus annuus]|nr:hypothetical protein HanLR1_Chr05g0167951 [Helianthus annuus]